MTARELYEWALKNNSLDKELVTYDGEYLVKIDDAVDDDKEVRLVSEV